MNNQSLLERRYSGRRAELKRVILTEALACFLEYGIETTTIEMIRERAQTSVGAIYHHFKNKEGLVAALYILAIEDQAERRDQALLSAQSLQQGIQVMTASYIDWVMDYPDFARFLYAAHFSISKSAQQEELKQKNAARNQHLLWKVRLKRLSFSNKKRPQWRSFFIALGFSPSPFGRRSE